MKCPILTVAKVIKPEANVRNDCVDVCAWWDANAQQCSVVSSISLLKGIEDQAFEIERNTRK